MAGRLSVACVSLLAVLAFLLLFASGTHVEAATYKMGYSSELSCDGPDTTPGTVDDSCTPDATYGPYGEGLHADLVSYFDVYVDRSMYSILATMGTPSTWQIATDNEIPNGSYVGDVVALSTLALFGGECTSALEVRFHMYDCSTDITDTISWDGAISGKNLTYGHEDGLPAGCLQYPDHVLAIVGNVQPRARYYGFTTVLPGMPPTQLQFMMFNPGELTGQPAPKADFSDDLGYINFTVLDNPNIPSASDSALDELCTPLGTTTNLLGLTGGEGVLDVDVFAPEDVPEAAGTFWNVGDACGDGVDNDGNTRIDEMCGIVRVTNPAANSGIYGTGSHMAGGYSESYRDADGDTIANNEDECPYDVDIGTDTDGDHIDDVCDPTNDPGPLADEDGDGWRNQADNCPLVFQTSQANDADDDNIGAACDTDDNVADGPYLNDLEWGSVCIEAADTDGDGWCDATEDLVGPGGVLSDKNDDTSTPEYYGIDWVVNAADNPPGAAPQSCDNWTYYDVNSGNAHGGVAPEIDDDGDTVVNAADPNCDPAAPISPTLPADIEEPAQIGPVEKEIACIRIDHLSSLNGSNHFGWFQTTPPRGGQPFDCDLSGPVPIPALPNPAYIANLGTDDLDWSQYNVAIDKTVTLAGVAPTPCLVGLDGTVPGAGPAVVGPLNEFEPEGYSTQGPTALALLRFSIGLPPGADNCAYTYTVVKEAKSGWGPLVPPLVTASVSGSMCADTDQDGIYDSCPAEPNPDKDSDNCPNDANPSQLDTDSDGKGDACDPDDDADKIFDTLEWVAGTDPKNVCDPRNFDLSGDNEINILDVLLFKDPLALADRPCYPPDDYSICEGTYRSDP